MTELPAFADGKLPGVSPAIYSDADFRAIARIAHTDAGIILPKGKAMLVYSRIAPLVRRYGSTSFSDFITATEHDHAQRKAMIDALTTNHTFFFREGHHFKHLTEQVRPALAQKLRSGNPVRLWSAGCSTGEETWSIMLSMLGEDRAQGLELARKDLLMLASDLSTNVLIKAQQAQYAVPEIKDVPQALRDNWLIEQGDVATVHDAARAIVRFRELNLHEDWPMRRPFDVIFCRNVMIYFDPEAKERLITRLAQQLAPGGHLYVGHSERASGPATQLLELVGPTIYRRRAA